MGKAFMSSVAAITSQLRDWLTSASLPASGRLPSERELAELLAVKRVQLRAALAVMEVEGLISRHVGRGTFATAALTRNDIDVTALAKVTNPIQAMQVRLIIEPESARLAALNATFNHISELKELTVSARRAKTWADYSYLDGRFHNLIADATGNSLLAAMQRVVNDVRRVVVWEQLNVRPSGPPADYHSFAEHEQIVSAIAGRNPPAAKAAMLAHLNRTLEALTAN